MLAAYADVDLAKHFNAAQTHRLQPATALPARPIQDCIERTSIRKLYAKDHVFSEGDPRTHVFQIQDGVVMIYRMLPDGRRQVIDFSFPGDFIGLGTAANHAFSAESTCDVKIRCIPVPALETAARNDPDIALALYKAVSQELSSARSLLVSIGQRSAIERVATFLVGLCERLSSRTGLEKTPVIELPMRRADIGDLLGLTIETVSRTITKLKTMGVIDVTHGTLISIRNLDRLKDLTEAY